MFLLAVELHFRFDIMHLTTTLTLIVARARYLHKEFAVVSFTAFHRRD